MQLPTFKYHPRPLETGSIVASEAVCVCCGESQGFIYRGPVYAVEDLDDRLCPWCIASGAAHEKFNASFTDEAGIGDYGRWEPVPRSVVEEVALRTPGFSGWQQERWWTHCNDAAEFLGAVGYTEAASLGPDMLAALAADTGMEDETRRDQFVRSLRIDGSPVGFAFRCLHCGKLGGYTDAH
ncbi:uncharacterized protein CbrC (UPF0167 family) [Inquilinus ginsengisoli]|uniref:CbrC family protein n=1 Tax=Inquilinus ginsengisoli TaxID=363840 RepID=UPI003D213941